MTEACLTQDASVNYKDVGNWLNLTEVGLWLWLHDRQGFSEALSHRTAVG